MAYLLTFIFTLLSANYDKDKTIKDHSSRWILRAIVVGSIAFLTKTSIFIHVFLFYALFDYMYNILRGNKWNYIGTTAISDQLINKYLNWQILLVIKLFLITISIIL